MDIVRNFSSLLFEPAEHKVLLVGLRGAGTTTLLYRLKMISTIPTFSHNIQSIEYKKRRFCVYDFGDCSDHIARTLVQCNLNTDSLVFFLHDCTSENVDESVKILHEHVEDMLNAGARFLWIVLNKLDAGGREKMLHTKHQFEREMENRYRGRLIWKVMALESHGGWAGEPILEVFDDVSRTLKKHRNFSLVSASPSSPELQGSNHVAISSDTFNREILQDVHQNWDSETTWQEIQSGSITLTSHRDRIRAAYMLVLDCLSRDQSILEISGRFPIQIETWDCAQTTRNRTLSIFWFYQLQMAILELQHARGGLLPSRDDIENHILPENPYLLNQNLWREYYSETLMQSPQSEKYYCLPDLKDLPSPITSTAREFLSSSQPAQSERIPRFAFAVVRAYLTTKLDRSWVITQALSALQSATMRTRASCTTMPPYSETQTMFWISRVHSLVCSAIVKLDSEATQKKTSDRETSLKNLTYNGFREIVPLDCNDWKPHYSPKLWNSVAARATFVAPDIKPLRNTSDAVRTLTLQAILNVQRANRALGLSPELPSDEELALYFSIGIKQAGTIPSFPFAVYTHGQMLFSLFQQLGAYSSSPDGGVDFAMDIASALPGSLNMDRDSRVFWCEQVREALVEFRRTAENGRHSDDSRHSAFERFLRGSIHLAYDDLEEASRFRVRQIELHKSIDVCVAEQRSKNPEKRETLEAEEVLYIDSDCESVEDKLTESLEIESWEVI